MIAQQPQTDKTADEFAPIQRTIHARMTMLNSATGQAIREGVSYAFVPTTLIDGIPHTTYAALLDAKRQGEAGKARGGNTLHALELLPYVTAIEMIVDGYRVRLNPDAPIALSHLGNWFVFVVTPDTAAIEAALVDVLNLYDEAERALGGAETAEQRLAARMDLYHLHARSAALRALLPVSQRAA